MRTIPESEKFTAFVVAFRIAMNDEKLARAVAVAGNECNQEFEQMKQAWIEIATKLAMPMMNEALKIAEQYTTDEIDIIMENENESE
jgi:hypothetical protein